MTLDLMMDMETLSTRPNAALLSIAVVPFQPNGDGPAEGEPTFHQYLQLEQQVEAGLHVDPNTVLWWLRQDRDAQWAQASAERLRPASAAVELISYFVKFPDACVWSYGAAEDNVWLRSFFRAMGFDCPVSYRNVRCLRTLADLAGQYGAAGSVATRHNAYFDCLDQIDHAQKCFKALRAMECV